VAIRCELARSAAAVNRRRRSPAAAAEAGHEDGDAPESHLFLEDGATIQADAGIGSTAAGERFSARCSLDRGSVTGRPI
jgi:hypothetical protein